MTADLAEHPDACPRCGYVLVQPPPPVPTSGRVPEDALPRVGRHTTPPMPRPAPAARPARGISAASVPTILLGLGATCLLVAAVIFLAVAWSWLGVDGRTAVLVALTATTGGLAQWFARRGLTVAAEAVTAVSLGLVVVDLAGARHAGWLGSPRDDAFLAVVGLALVAAAAVAFVPARSLRVPQAVAPAGLAAAVVGLASHTGHPQLLAAAGVVGLTALVVLGLRWSADLLPWVAGVLAATALTCLTGLAVLDATAHPSFRGLWVERHGAGLLATAALVLLPWAVARRSDDVRELACACSAAVLTWAVAAPALDEGATTITLSAAAAVAVWAGATVVAPRRWQVVTRVPLAGSLAVGLAVPALLAAQGVANLVTVAEPFTADASVRLDPATSVAEPLLLPLGVVVLVVAAAAVLPRDRRLVVGGLVAAYVGALLTAALHPVPLWLPVLAAGPFGILISPPNAVLTLAVLGELVVLSAGLALRRSGVVARLAGLALPVTLAAFLWTGGHVLDLPLHQVAVAVVVVVGLVAVVRPRLEVEIEVEVAAAVAAALSAYAGVVVAPDRSVWAAVELTVAGALVVLTSLVHRDRRACAWPGGVLLVLATWVRLQDVGVEAPEPYTLPAAVALLLVGLHRLRRDPDAGTVTVLSPGLVLATVPTLLWALADPLSERAVVTGLVCLALLVGGAALRWTAPVLVGGVSGLALVLCELAPYAERTPQWVLIGAAGTLLIGAGVTWESRVRDVRRSAAYLGRLR